MHQPTFYAFFFFFFFEWKQNGLERSDTYFHSPILRNTLTNELKTVPVRLSVSVFYQLSGTIRHKWKLIFSLLIQILTFSVFWFFFFFFKKIAPSSHLLTLQRESTNLYLLFGVWHFDIHCIIWTAKTFNIKT